MSELPKGWATATLGELCPGRVEQREPGAAPIPYIDIGSIDRATKAISPAQTVTAKSSPTRARQWVAKGDVLVSMTRPNLNAVALVPMGLHGAVASTGFDVLRTQCVLPEWIFNRVRTREFIVDVCKGLQGVVYPAIRPNDVRSHALPVPPLAEQRRIVEAIESHSTRIDAAGAILEQVQRNVKRYRASVLRAAVEGRLVPTEAELARAEGRDYEPATELLTRVREERDRDFGGVVKGAGQNRVVVPDVSDVPALPVGWCWTSVDAVGDVLLGRRRAPEYVGAERPYLRVANVKDDRLALADVLTMPFDGRESRKYTLQAGDVIVSEGQSPELVGQSATYRGGIEGLCFQATLHRFRPWDCGPSSEFAQLVFRSHVRSGVFRRRASITTNIAHLTLEKFKASPFPLPPAAEERRIVDAASRLLSVADELDVELSRQIVRLAHLRQAILKWAFEGKLVDQDPSDEPASLLLDRIKAERAAATPAPKSRANKPRAKVAR